MQGRKQNGQTKGTNDDDLKERDYNEFKSIIIYFSSNLVRLELKS